MEFPNVIDKPGARARARYTKKPLTTNVNKPSVSKIAGNAKMVKIGFSTELTIENIHPAKMNDQTDVAPEVSLPKRRIAIQIPNEFKIQRSKNVANCLFILSHYIQIMLVCRGVLTTIILGVTVSSFPVHSYAVFLSLQTKAWRICGHRRRFDNNSCVAFV